jgi:uncharacterized protein (TIGR03435 family)
MRLSVALLLTGVIAATGHAQDTHQPAFEVVSVKPVDFLTVARATGTGFHIEPGRVYCNCALSLMLQNAYGIRPYRMIAPPGLPTPTVIFHLDARFPAGATTDQIPVMMRAMLADRFHIQAHREFRDEPVYALKVAPGGLKLTPSPPAPPPDPSVPPPLISFFPSVAPGSISMNGNSGELRIHGSFTMAKLVWFLSSDMDREVVDQTGLTAEFEIELNARIPDRRLVAPGIAQWAEDDPRMANIPPIFSEIQKLGLRLEPSRAPVEHLVIDKMESTPTPN